MKVIHVNTHTYGGAGIVAKRLHIAMCKMGLESTLITQFGVNDGSIPNHVFFKNARLKYFLKKKLSNPLLFPVAKFIQSLRPHPNLANKTEGIEIFSPLYTADKFHFQEFESSDIINLHWVNNFIDNKSFFKNLSTKKFVWTLHDMNPITGGCHYADGCTKFESDCKKCPQLKNTIDEDYANKVLNTKIHSLSDLKDEQLTIVSPSTWLLELSKKSKITKRFSHKKIFNPGFEEVNILDNRESLRREMNLPIDKKIVLFVSDNLKTPRKGINFLFSAVRTLPQRKDLILLGIGHPTDSPNDLHINYTGSISDNTLLAKYYYCSDCFVTPTLAENSPLVVIEALMCGIPVVASNVGGLADLVNVNNGILFPPKDIDRMAAAIIEILYNKNYDREKIKKGAQINHNSLKVAHEYKKLYEDILRLKK